VIKLAHIVKKLLNEKLNIPADEEKFIEEKLDVLIFHRFEW
jgi:hypothetical protein